MREYKVLVSPGALLDLQNTYDYILDQYASPLDAERWLDTVKEAIHSLRLFPAGYSRLEIEPWFSLGVRSRRVKHHRILYLIDEDYQTVKVIAVKYGRIDFTKLKL